MNDFFNSGFIYIRSQHITPRIKYGIDAKKSNFWRLKIVITEKLNNITHINNSSFDISITKEDYYKLIYCESELFLNKSYIQYHDYKKMLDNSSGSWSFVTLYYFLFFNLCCLFRFCDRGFVHLTQEYTRKLENAHLALYSLPVSISEGNYFFQKSTIDQYGNVILNFKKAKTTHQAIWSEFEKILSILISKSSDKELAIYTTMLSHLNSFNSSYASTLRNDLNYNAETIMLDFNNQITCYELMDLNESFYQSFLKIDEHQDTLTNKIKSITHISNFIYNLNFELANEFYNRSSYGRDFIKMRKIIT